MKATEFPDNKFKINMTNATDALQGNTVGTRATAQAGEDSVRGMFAYIWWKNLFDRILALIAIIVSSPLMLLIAIGIRLDSPGGAIYRREQVGEDGRTFTAYKFRSMYVNNDDSKYKAYLIRYITEDAPYTVDSNGQAVYKVINDPRVTRFGALLRKTNLEELPQFLNVLRGEMSIVGPRPDIPFAVGMYKDWHRKRLEVKPGITGLWQVSRRKELSFEEMVRLDIEYIEKQSLTLDLKIILSTVSTILRRDGS